MPCWSGRVKSGTLSPTWGPSDDKSTGVRSCACTGVVTINATATTPTKLTSSVLENAWCSYSTGTRRLSSSPQFLTTMWVFPLLKSLLPVVVAFLLPTTDTLDHRRVGNGTHRHGLFQEPMEELPAMA